MGKKGAASGSGTAAKQSVTVYRENRETSPKDTRGSTEFSQSDTPGGSLTKVSTDKRTVGTPDDK